MDKRSNAGAGMAYSERKQAYNMQYAKDHFKGVLVRFQNDYYDERLKPAADAAEEPVAAFIKKAVDERIERLNQ